MPMTRGPLGRWWILSALVGAASSAVAAGVPGPGPSSALVEPAQLKHWMDQGYRTDQGERVVIVDVVPSGMEQDAWFAGDLDALKSLILRNGSPRSPQFAFVVQLDQKKYLGHIPGARSFTSHDGGEVATRSDGPLAAVHEVAPGASIQTLLQNYAISPKDVLVLTSSQQNPWMVCGPRLWWTLRYWGYPAEKLKLLDGSNRGFVSAGYALERGAVEPTDATQDLQLAKLGPRHLKSRVSLGEMIALVDSGQTTDGSMVLLDVRQPPAAFYLRDARDPAGTAKADGIPDILQVPGYRYDGKERTFTRDADHAVFTLDQMLFSPAAQDGRSARVPFNPSQPHPVALPNAFVDMHHQADGDHLAIPITPKGVAFEGIIRGARLVKSDSYNLTIPALVGPDNRFKPREELLKLFAKAGIDGKRPVVLYCNTGALSSFYFFVLHELCGFENVRMYDGSWMEWGNLTAFEPGDATYLQKATQMVYPAYPSLMPAVLLFDGRNGYLEWKDQRWVDAVSGKPVPTTQVKPGGALNGQLRWDTLHRSEHVVFTSAPKLKADPAYRGLADRIRQEDAAFGH